MVFAGEEKNLQGEGTIRSFSTLVVEQEACLPWPRTGSQNTSQKGEVSAIRPGASTRDSRHLQIEFLSQEKTRQVRQGSSLSNDRFEGRKYDYMITNPPFGVSWKSDKEVMEEVTHGGRSCQRASRIGWLAAVFADMISKMNPGLEDWAHFNGSPLFTGDAEAESPTSVNGLSKTIWRHPHSPTNVFQCQHLLHLDVSKKKYSVKAKYSLSMPPRCTSP